MKRILYSIGVICLMTITSCQTTVSDYKTEIEDAVRFYLSSVELMAHHILEEGDEALFDELLADFSSTSEETDFKSLIKKKKNEGNLFAHEMLGYYEDLSIILSEPICEDTNTEIEKAWSFKEVNSQVNFLFTIKLKENIWNIVPKSEEDIERYMWRIILTGNDKRTHPEIDELQQIKETIKTRIRYQYNEHCQYNDNEIMSEEFYSVFNRAQLLDDSEIGWPDWDIWRCTNGLYAELHSINVEIISNTDAIAHIELFYPETGDQYCKVDMPMVYENGDWYVDDIIDITNSYSIKDIAQSIVEER